PFVRAKRPVRRQTQKRCPRQVLRLVGLRHRETVVPALPNFRPVHPVQACRSAPRPIYFRTPVPAKSSPAGENSPPPSQSLFSALIRRFRFPPASHCSVRLRASPFRTRDALGFAHSPSN